MRKLALLLACLISMANGRRRLPNSLRRARDSAHTRGTANPSKALAVLLQMCQPQIAFHLSGVSRLHSGAAAGQCHLYRPAPRVSMESPAATTNAPGPIPEPEYPFEDWAEEAGIDAPNLAVTGLEDLRGVRVLRDIPDGGELAVVPRTSCLDLSSLSPEDGSPCKDLVPDELWAQMRWFERLACWLVYEGRLGEQSLISGYIGHLPKPETFADGVLEWNDEELAELAYPPVIAGIREQAAEQERLFETLQKEGGPLAQFVTLQELRWAMSNVLSRAFMSSIKSQKELMDIEAKRKKEALAQKDAAPRIIIIPQWVKDTFGKAPPPEDYDPGQGLEMAMMPMMDAFNHWSGAKNDCSYDSSRDAFVLVAGEGLPKGTEAFISYGKKSNDDLIQLFGFVEEDNPHDRFLSIGLAEYITSEEAGIFTDDEELQTRFDMLYENDLEEALLGELSATGAPSDMMHALRVLLCTADEAFDVEDLDRPASLRTEERVWDALKGYCKMARAALGGPRTKDIEAANRARMRGQTRLAMACQYRAEKKRLLVVLEKRLTNLAARSKKKGKIQRLKVA